jgi:hypothetical protein
LFDSSQNIVGSKCRRYMSAFDFVIPVLARRSASARRRGNGNPCPIINSIYGFLLEFIPHADAGQE